MNGNRLTDAGLKDYLKSIKTVVLICAFPPIKRMWNPCRSKSALNAADERVRLLFLQPEPAQMPECRDGESVGVRAVYCKTDVPESLFRNILVTSGRCRPRACLIVAA